MEPPLNLQKAFIWKKTYSTVESSLIQLSNKEIKEVDVPNR